MELFRLNQQYWYYSEKIEKANCLEYKKQVSLRSWFGQLRRLIYIVYKKILI